MRVLAALVTTSVALGQFLFQPDPGQGPLYPIERDGKWGYMDRQGSPVIEPTFARAFPFYNGLAAVLVNGKVGFVDEHGALRIRAQFDEAGEFSGKLTPVRLGRRWGFVDRSGRMVVEPQFQAAASFHDGLARVLVWERLHCGEQEFTKDNANEEEFSFEKGDFQPCWVPDPKHGYVDESGKLVVVPQYPYAADAADGLALVRVGTGQEARYGFIDHSGAFVIPAHFKWAESFRESLAPVTLDKKWGYIDRSGTFVIPAEYDRAYGFQNGAAFVQRGTWLYIDRSGKTVRGPTTFPVPNFVNGVAIVRRGGHSVYIDSTGREIGRRD